jgi:hypothetical protein
MTNMMRALLLFALTSCGSSILDKKAYSQSCAQASDCVPVFLGDVCTVCACANAAVATSSRARYDADAAAARRLCGPQPAIACAPCSQAIATCTNGVCGL